MPGGNGITIIIIAGSLGLGVLQGFAQDQPIVLGYERFHSKEPSFEGGRLLFNELGCANCHDKPTGLPTRKGPVLNGVLQRNQLEWIRSFLKKPQEKKPGTTMPNMLLRDEEIEAVLHFLGSLQSKRIPKAFMHVNAERGMALYHEFGCVACHAPGDQFIPFDGRPDPKNFTYPSVPLANLSEKYDLHSLSNFLYNVHSYRPQGRMPQFKFDTEEGGDIAAYLLNYQEGYSYNYPRIPKFSPNPSLVKIGQAVFESRNCAACHDTSTTEKIVSQNYELPSEFLNLEQIQTHPAYPLSMFQLLSLETYFYAEQNDSIPNANLHLQALNCMACHERDDIGGPDNARQRFFSGNRNLGDAGRIPPSLTGIEDKLKRPWLKGVLQGKLNVRPYLETQMPVYGPSAIGLLESLSNEAVPSTNHRFQSAKIEAGQKLLGTQGGYGCINCHDWGERKSLGISALDLSTIPDRLHLDWLHQYLRDPSVYQTQILMPSFWPNGKASNNEILGGDSDAQISSIYAFALSGEGVPGGFPEKNTQEFEIVPIEKPIVQRAFFEGGRTHALLVGFPEGVHLAFDGKAGQPAAFWRGAFFDAYKTWFSRFPEFEKPLGEDVLAWPKPEAMVLAEFKGYRFDGDGVPEFILKINGETVYERFSPERDPSGFIGIERTIRYTNKTQLNDPRLNHPEEIFKYEVVGEDPLVRTFVYQW